MDYSRGKYHGPIIFCSVCGNKITTIPFFNNQTNSVFCSEECRATKRTDAPLKPVSILVNSVYNNAGDCSSEIINRVRGIEVRCPAGTLTFKAKISDKGEVTII